MRYDPKHKDETHYRLLDTAARLLRTGGPDAVGVSQVMREAGLTNGGFYGHFRSREELLAQATRHAFDDGVAMFARTCDDRPAADALRAYLCAYLSTAHRDKLANGCPAPVLCGDVAHLPDSVRTELTAGITMMIDRLAPLLEALEVLSPRSVALSIVAEITGAIALARVLADEEAASIDILENARQSALARAGLEVAA